MRPALVPNPYGQSGNPWDLPRADSIPPGPAGDQLVELVAGILFCETVTLMIAPPASLKSTLAFEIARAVARGAPFAGRPTRQQRVVYLDLENSRRVVRKRAEAFEPVSGPFLYWGTWHEHGFERIPPLDGRFDPRERGGLHLLRREVLEWITAEPTLLVLDSLVRFHNEPENDAQRFAMVYNVLRWYRDAGTTVLALHHTTVEAPRARGGTEATAGADVVIYLDRFEPDALKLSEQKNREAPERKNALRLGVDGFVEYSTEPGVPTAQPQRGQRRQRGRKRAPITPKLF